MKKYNFLFLFVVVFALFFVFSGRAKAVTCSLSFSSPHANYILVGDQVTWTLKGWVGLGKSYWYGTKNGATDVSNVNTGLGSSFSWTTDPYTSSTVGSYMRYVVVRDLATGGLICETNKVYVDVVSPKVTDAAISGSLSATAGLSTTYTFFAKSNTSDTTLTYKVNWGDGLPTEEVSGPNVYTGKAISHTWKSSGTYTISFTASLPNNSLVYKTANKQISVAAATSTTTIPITSATVSNASISGPLTLTAGVNNTYNFYAKSDASDLSLSFKINWGDGSVTQTTAANSPAGVTFPLTHQWTSGGAYTITFTASLPSNPSVYKTATHGVSVNIPITTPTPTPITSAPSAPTPTPTPYPATTFIPYIPPTTPTPTPTPTPYPATTFIPYIPPTTPTPTPTSPVVTSRPIPISEPVNPIRLYSLAEIYDGDLIRAQDGIAVWIVKIVGEKRYKRWLFGPQIFTAYGHLGFHKVKNVSKETLNRFDTVILIRKDGDAKVYELTDFVPGTRAVKRWIPTKEVFLQRGFDFDSVYITNEKEFNLYQEGASLPTSQSEPVSGSDLTASFSEIMLRFLGR